MEEPFADTMEMASPYTGHVDDFEIDIDIMEDHPVTADIDFDVQDASPAAGEQPHDADMMDDVPEVTVTNTSQYDTQTRLQNNDTFYSAQETYESEMVDDEIEVAGDALIVNTETAPAVERPNEENGSAPHDAPEFLDVQDNQDAGSGDSSNIENGGDRVLDESKESDYQDETTRLQPLTNNTHEQADQLHAGADLAQPADHTEHKVDSVVDEVEVDATKASEEEAILANDNHADYEVVPAGPRSPETAHVSEKKENRDFLHSVKDEDLAYEGMDRLLGECRTILGDHTSDSESLVFNVESLGIQLSEDNIFTKKVTLSQLVELYVNLCRNEGVGQPEPLYLTLNTRPNLAAEVSTLLKAVEEGKGISEIQRWDEYEQQNTEQLGDPHHTISSQLLANEDDDDEDEGKARADDNGLSEDEKAEQTAVTDFDDQDDGKFEEDVGNVGAIDATPNQAVSNDPELEHKEQDEVDSNTIEHEYETAKQESRQEGQYDFEDHSDSTGTLTQAPPEQPDDQQPELSNEPQQVDDNNAETGFGDYDNADFAAQGEVDSDLRDLVSAQLEEQAKFDAETSPDEINYSTHANAEFNPLLTSNADEGVADESYEEYVEEDGENAGEGDYEADTGGAGYEEDIDEEYYDEEEGDYGDEPEEETSKNPVPQPEQAEDSNTVQYDVLVESNEENRPLALSEANDEQPDDLYDTKEIAEPENRASESVRSTAGLPDDGLGLDEDIFADQEEYVQETTADQPTAISLNDSTNDGLDDLQFEDDYEDAEENITESTAPDTNPLERQESSTGKRARASEDDDGDFTNASTSDAKRTRSS
ncbi:hypothetical protein BGW36DRAFT_426745 [Talaromyces proteolyticus]|uniref:Uncharacterized protein n=1 Tax=Talaromyces proteolyticus TaxID=1131652 RepID=A0AAD4KRZ2_9EURO|nr:uncharacterized protein BGW36DRAFT_426745 [Talaromyces proteolyticus]KAH8699064.1 hypothetical protein BGW36DRAFT_426745 [Talaromyces proteolyticus]